jgi:hypothetical protein
MLFLQPYGKELVALCVPLITWALNTLFRAKAKLVFASPHTFTFLAQQPRMDHQCNVISPTQTVHTRSMLPWNSGREAATKVEWVFN